MASQEIAGIPWRDWIPDFKQPTTCQVDDCGEPVRLALHYTTTISYFARTSKVTNWVFCCIKHGDELLDLVITIRNYGPNNV